MVSITAQPYRVSLWGVIVGVLVLALASASLVLGGLAQAQDADIEYAENGKGAVATYSATDPDGSAIVSWTLATLTGDDADDADDFKIEDGVLSFKKSPDYETPKGGGQEATDTDNIYTVTVQATDATKRIGMKKVTVEVTNVEEGGSMRLSAVQPQAGASFYVIDEVGTTATVTDIKDGDEITSSIKWQWSKSTSKTTGFADIDKATEADYTPKDGDDGYYLRVTASYTDREGPNKSAQNTSSYPVQLAPSNNVAPKFADDQDPDTTDVEPDADRSIAENTPKGVDIGSPIEASDLNPGKLTYTLEGDDAAMFDIDRETGQLKTKDKLDFDADGGGGESHTVTVRATDPSGDPQVDPRVDDNSDIVVVNITVEDLDEDPQISASDTGNMLGGFPEDTDADATPGTTPVATFTAVVEPDDDEVSRWSLAGSDAGKFRISSAGALTFDKHPDYEKPGDADGDNIYEVTVRATDSDGRTGTKDVTVKVTNVDEGGAVTLSPTQHRVGVPITAELKDDDGGVYGIMWQWYDGAFVPDNPATNAIAGATSDTYAPKAGDIGDTLTAVATYRDAAGVDTDDTATLAGAAAVLRDTRNKAPVFKAKNAVITQAERSVAESATGDATDDDATDVSSDNVGGTIMAQDPNIDAPPAGEGDSLAFSLSGSDASKFRLRDAVADTDDATLLNVQIEVNAGTKFDYETKDTYMVTLTARDDYGETADLALTINITDVNDAPDVTGLGEVEYAENGKGAVATYSATDPDGSAIVSWTLATLTGDDADDADDFKIEDGVLSFKKSPDYETPKGGGQEATDTDTDNIYTVTVQATDATKRIGMKKVTVEVTNVEEGGSMRLSAVQPQAGASFYVIDEVGTTATVTDIKDGDEITSSIKWQWSKSTSKTTGFADIDKATEADYTPKDGDDGYYLRVTASYTDREGPNKSAQNTSSYPVQLAPSNNVAPKFADDQDPDTTDVEPDADRSIAENTPKGVDIGSPIEASDLNPGKLTYTLEGDDAAMFDIDRETGQLKTKDKLDFDADGGGGESHTVTVRATDPSGDPQVDPRVDDNSDIVVVNITVEDLDEDPQISASDTGNMLGGFPEDTDADATPGTTPVATFTAVVEPDDDEVSRWSLAGSDAGKFRISSAGALTFDKHPDYEKPGDADGDNIYEVTVRATDSDGRTGTKDVTVKVTNVDEGGAVTLSPTQHRVGVPITAELKDDDGGVYGIMWQWYDGAFVPDNPATNAIAGATSDTYAPKAGDIGDTLTAVATYRDAAGVDTDDTATLAGAAAVLRDTRNKAPVFKAKNAVITQAERSVAESATGDATDDDATDVSSDNVGGTIMAQDPNIDAPPAGEGDSLAFSLSGSDASKFRLRDAVADTDDATLLNVQIEVNAGTKFDYETKDTYMVTLTARDDYGETADLALTINITDVNDAPVISLEGLAANNAPAFAAATDTREVAENTVAGEDIGAPVAATDPDDDALTYTLSGADAASFDINPATGQLRTQAALDFEAEKNTYSVTVTATDGDNASDSIDVTITVTDMEDTPTEPESVLDRYDDNNSGRIDKDELADAVFDYNIDRTLSKADLADLVFNYEIGG